MIRFKRADPVTRGTWMEEGAKGRGWISVKSSKGGLVFTGEWGFSGNKSEKIPVRWCRAVRTIPKEVFLSSHRGLTLSAPENSMASFESAVQYGMELELDLWLTKDGVPVVMHDKTIDRTTNGKGEVRGMTYAELRRHRLSSGEPVPSLNEVLLKYGSRVRKIFLDMKSEDEGAVRTALAVFNMVRRRGLISRTVFLSEFPAGLRAIKKQDKAAEVEYDHDGPKGGEIAHREGFDYWGMTYNTLTSKLSDGEIETARARGIGITVWGVDGEKEVREAYKHGATVIMSHHPGDLIAGSHKPHPLCGRDKSNPGG